MTAKHGSSSQSLLPLNPSLAAKCQTPGTEATGLQAGCQRGWELAFRCLLWEVELVMWEFPQT